MAGPMLGLGWAHTTWLADTCSADTCSADTEALWATPGATFTLAYRVSRKQARPGTHSRTPANS